MTVPLGSLACKPSTGSPSGRWTAPRSITSATDREQTTLYRLVQQHAATFFEQAESAVGADLPQFVKDEFDAFLECGILAHGFLRLRCDDCGHDKLVAFSCKRRGFCSSCGARRTAQTAAHLVDHVIPHVPVRQWVLSLPIPLRLLLAAQPKLLTPVLQVVHRVITRHLRGQAGLSAHCKQPWHWRGRAVRLVDGTPVTLPDTASNQKRFPQLRSQKPCLGFPLCRVVGVLCLGSGALLDAAVGAFRGKGADEGTLLRWILDGVECGDVLLRDAYFCTYFLLATLIERGCYALFEQHGARRLKTDFRRSMRLGERDHLIVLTKPVSKPDWMKQSTTHRPGYRPDPGHTERTRPAPEPD